MTSQIKFTWLFMTLAVASLAQTPADPAELTNLRQNWKRATLQVTDPLDKKYVEALSALKMRFTKAGKLEEALAVHAELKKFEKAADAGGSADPAGAMTKNPLKDQILGTWSWNSGDKSDQSSIQFEKGGVGNHGGRGNVTWRMNDAGEITVTNPSKGKAVVRMDATGKSISGTTYNRTPVTGARIN